MRSFIIISARGRTKGDWKDIMKAGRIDILCHAVISSFYLSNAIRKDVKCSLLLQGPPDPVKHIEITYDDDLPISKKDVGNLLRSALWKYKPGKKVKAFPGVFIEKKPFQRVIEERSEIYYLDPKGKDITEIEFGENPTFVLGDHEGIPKNEMKYLKKNATKISLGKEMYFTSQCISFLNIWLDRK